jgi:hypothetical protein
MLPGEITLSGPFPIQIQNGFPPLCQRSQNDHHQQRLHRVAVGDDHRGGIGRNLQPVDVEVLLFLLHGIIEDEKVVTLPLRLDDASADFIDDAFPIEVAGLGLGPRLAVLRPWGSRGE